MNADFFVTPFPDVELGAYGRPMPNGRGPLSAYELYAGVRLDAHDADAGEPSLGAASAHGGRACWRRRSLRRIGPWDDMTLDGPAAPCASPSQKTLTLRGALARKSRVAGQVERYGWLPITASGGLADGNTYVGTLDLNPEVATSLEAGFDYASDRAYLRPTVYVSWVEDYIQGVPAEPNTPGVADTPLEMVSAMNGDPTPLRFSNVDARLYGIDADFGLVLTPSWRLDGVLTYVRGERDDVDDDLYRITPASLRLSATYEQAVWSASVETLMVAEQDQVSAENSELETPGHVVLNAYGRWAVNDQVSLSAGVENILDQPYRDHLAGYNRNSGLGVPVGERLPGVRRGGLVAAQYPLLGFDLVGLTGSMLSFWGSSKCSKSRFACWFWPACQPVMRRNGPRFRASRLWARARVTASLIWMRRAHGKPPCLQEYEARRRRTPVNSFNVFLMKQGRR